MSEQAEYYSSLQPSPLRTVRPVNRNHSPNRHPQFPLRAPPRPMRPDNFSQNLAQQQYQQYQQHYQQNQQEQQQDRQLRPFSPQQRPPSPQNRPPSPQSRAPSPQQRPLSPQQRPYSPQQRPYSPQQRQQHFPQHQEQQQQPYWQPEPDPEPEPEPEKEPESDSQPTSRSVSYRGRDSDGTIETTKRPFKSYRLRGPYEKPWLGQKDLHKTRRNDIIMGVFLAIGFALAAIVVVLMVLPYREGPYCLVLEDKFSSIDDSVWTHEVQLDGFGTGSFDWTTTDEKNSYVDSNGLHIVPTLTNETTDINNDLLYHGYILDLNTRKDGKCTGKLPKNCVIHSNGTAASMIPPVRSARLSTKGKKTIRYGRVEVVAKMPKGDWLWPAIWMMPEDSVYGEWPKSGEIDIMESRGNAWDYPAGGNDLYSGTLHWGPTPSSDGYWRSTAGKAFKRTDFTKAFHTFGMEWTEKYIYFYVDSRLAQILYYSFDPKDPLWNRGGFDKYNENSTLLSNPWSGTASTTGNAPFDQKFFLILNVAVGAKNGWFPDTTGDKPWLDFATNAQWTFYSQANKWLPTWGEGDARGMTVKSVKMWQKGACGAADL